VTSCAQVATFLQQVAARQIQTPVGPADIATLGQLGILQQYSASEFQQVQAEIQQLEQAQAAIAQESQQRAVAAQALASDTAKTHSILFHLEGVDKEHATLERLGQEQDALKTIDADLAKRQQDFAQLLLKRSMVEAACSYDNGYLAITTVGRVALRDLSVALYRVGDTDFAVYWAQARGVDETLTGLANAAAAVHSPLVTDLPGVDPSYLWAVSIGMVKVPGDVQPRFQNFLAAYQGATRLSANVENRLMAAEILSVAPTAVPDSLAALPPLLHEVDRLGVPAPSALGVAAMLLLGRRGDGTYATEPLRQFLAVTQSYESAALLAVINRPYDELMSRFTSIKALYSSWGYSSSEDTELSSAYLAVSELPLETVNSKVAILAHGISGYLAYPLVAASILASIPVLEANETLNLLEKAYEILGQRTGPMSQAELICLAVRMIHGIDVRSVNELDPTAAKAPAQPSFYYGSRPPIFWAPIVLVHGVYYSTYSGIGGVHPGHVHAWGGGGFAGGGG